MVNQVRMNKNFISLLVGISLLATNQIIKKYYSIPDFLYGIFIGIGIGLVLFAITRLAKLKS